MSTTLERETFVLGPEHNGLVMTPEEFDAITEYDENYRYELIHGVLIVNAIPAPQETGPNQFFGHRLLSYQETHPQGHALDDTLPEQYVRTATGRRRADRLIWAGLGRQPDPRTDVATIALEFVSRDRRSFRRDYIEKRDEYRDAGIQEYGIIDRFRRTMTVYRRQGDGWSESVLTENDVYRTEFLPGFELPLARLLGVADRYPQE
ncbi:MAG: Uma2 family endonuclease [Planctomycetaceae bacterium]